MAIGLNSIAAEIREKLKTVLNAQGLEVVADPSEDIDISDHQILFKRDGLTHVVSLQVPSLNRVGLDQCSVNESVTNEQPLSDGWKFVEYVGVRSDIDGSLAKLERALSNNAGKFDITDGTYEKVVSHPLFKIGQKIAQEAAMDVGVDIDITPFNSLSEGHDNEGFVLSFDDHSATVEFQSGVFVFIKGDEINKFQNREDTLRDFSGAIRDFLYSPSMKP